MHADFRLNASRFLMTFSQTGHRGDVNEIMGFHLAYFPPVSYYVVGHELHQDGGHHYHVVVVFVEKLNIRDSTFFDWMFDDVHPNIIAIKHGKKNLDRAVKYCKKDQDYAESVDFSKAFEVTENLSSQLARMVVAGASDQELFEWNPGYFMRSRRMIVDLRLCSESWGVKLVPYVQPAPPDVFSEWRPVYDWIISNIGVPRQDRQRHLWLWGQTHLGKSTVAKRLSTMVNTFFAPKNNWLTGYNDSYQLVVFDDYNGSMRMSDMNSFCQGTVPYRTEQKGAVEVVKKKNPPCIVVSNQCPEQVYHKAFEHNKFGFGALLDRFIVLEVKSYFDFWPPA